MDSVGYDLQTSYIPYNLIELLLMQNDASACFVLPRDSSFLLARTKGGLIFVNVI